MNIKLKIFFRFCSHLLNSLHSFSLKIIYYEWISLSTKIKVVAESLNLLRTPLSPYSIPKFSVIYWNNPPVPCSLCIDAMQPPPYSSQATSAYIVYSIQYLWHRHFRVFNLRPLQTVFLTLNLKGKLNEIVHFRLFNESVSSGPLSIPLGSVLIST